MSFLNFIIVAVVLYLCYEDLKHRMVSVIWMTFLSVACLLNWLRVDNLIDVMMNLGYLFIIMVIAKLHSLIRRTPGGSSIGGGDLWFIGICGLAFETIDFILWVTLAMTFAIILHSILRHTFIYKQHKTVPLISYLGVAFISCLYSPL